MNFTGVHVPNVFFSDSTGPCYHTAQDEVKVVDFWKLDQQTQIAYKVVDRPRERGRPPDVLGRPTRWRPSPTRCRCRASATLRSPT